MNTEAKAPGDVAEGETMGPVDRTKVLRSMLKQVSNPELPFEVRNSAFKAIKEEFDNDPKAPADAKAEVDLVADAFNQTEQSKGTDEYRGFLTAISPKSKSGQAYIEKLRAAVKALVGAGKPEKEPKPKKEKQPKVASNKCLCGCGKLCHNQFAPGHDATVKGILLKISRAALPLDSIPEPLKDDTATLRDLLGRWKFPTDADGNLVVTAPPPKPAKADPPAA